MSGLLIVANLDGESELAARAPGATRRTLPRAVLEAISVAGSLLRVYAEDDDDLLWTPSPLDPERFPAVPGLARPRLVSGPLLPLARGRRTVAWQEIGDIVARVAHRGFALELAARLDPRLGARLPGSRLASTPDEALAAIRRLGGPWIAKAALSASGRERWRGDGPPASPDLLRRSFARLLARGGGALLVEPWCERLWDVGCVASTGSGDTRISSVHRLRVDGRGQVVGIELAVDGPGDGGLESGEIERLRAVVEEVGKALVAAGYRGPFGVDAWRYRDPDGVVRFHPLGEINPRLTLGRVARALVDRLREPLGWGGDERVALLFGRGAEAFDGQPRDRTLLWLPGEDGRSVWIERLRELT